LIGLATLKREVISETSDVVQSGYIGPRLRLLGTIEIDSASGKCYHRVCSMEYGVTSKGSVMAASGAGLAEYMSCICICCTTATLSAGAFCRIGM
jgi:hypothetical protein